MSFSGSCKNLNGNWLRPTPKNADPILGDESIEEMKRGYEAERDKGFKSRVCAEYSR